MDEATWPEHVLPPEGEYESRESLLAAINSWAKPRGYAFTTGKSTKTSSGRVKVIFACDRNRQPPSTSDERTRRTSSRKTGCKFSVLAKESLDGGKWVLSHRPDKDCAKHNHPPSEDPSAHPAHRRFDEHNSQTVADLALSGITPRDIRTYLHNHSDSLVTQRDIYNRMALTRRELREGQSSIQALVDHLHREGFWCRVKLDTDNRLTAIFFARPDSVAYLQRNPDVLLLDCTYKTNKHHMPLLDMVGVDSCQRSFCIAFAFLSGESEEDYSWALEHLRSLYEHELPSVILTDRCLAAMKAAATWFSSSKALLCLWHVNKAVLQHCRPSFVPRLATDQADDEAWQEFYASWHSIVASADEKTFEERVSKFAVKYGNAYLESVGYIKTYWLDPYKEMIVKAWVDEHLHFGNIATSRAEGIHSLIKSHIKTSTFDLFDVWQAMKHAITNQLKELKHLRNSQQLRIPLDVSGVLFDAVRGWVSHEALRKVQEQRHLVHKSREAPCRRTFTASHGLPCSHTLKTLEEQNQTLSLKDFHPHWHIRRDAVQPRPILEPRRVTDVLSQNPTRPITSTRREPSEFERVESQRKAPSRCSKCHTLGHTMTSRVCPLRFADLLSDPLVPGPAVPVAAPHALDQTTVSAHLAEPFSVTSHLPLSSALVGTSAEAGEQAPTSTSTSLPQCNRPSSSPNLPPTSADSSLGIETHSRGLREEAHCEEAPRAQPLQRYDSPMAIYARYVAARNAWYVSQPAGSIKTNQQYRKAKGLPQRYNRESYEWCLDYKQMSRHCVGQDGSREWTKEEMMAYLDWSKAEDERAEAQVAQEMGDKAFTNKRRGMKGLWELAEKDSKEQEALHSISWDAEQCIIVRT